MMFKAFVKDKKTGEPQFLEYDYDKKSDFINDLRQNGYSIHRVEPKDLYDFVMDNFNGEKHEWEIAKKLYKEGKPLTKEEYEKLKDWENENSLDEDAKAKLKEHRRLVREDTVKTNPGIKAIRAKIKDGEMPPLSQKAFESIKGQIKDFDPADWEGYVETENTLDATKDGDDKLDHEVVNDFAIDAIKDNFTPPGAKSQKEKLKEEVDTNDNGKIEVDEMADFQKSLDDYAAKNKKGREDIPATYKR